MSKLNKTKDKIIELEQKKFSINRKHQNNGTLYNSIHDQELKSLNRELVSLYENRIEELLNNPSDPDYPMIDGLRIMVKCEKDLEIIQKINTPPIYGSN